MSTNSSGFCAFRRKKARIGEDLLTISELFAAILLLPIVPEMIYARHSSIIIDVSVKMLCLTPK